MRKLALVSLALITMACSSPAGPSGPVFDYFVRADGPVTANGRPIHLTDGEWTGSGVSPVLTVRQARPGCVFATVTGPSGVPYGLVHCGSAPSVTVTGR